MQRSSLIVPRYIICFLLALSACQNGLTPEGIRAAGKGSVQVNSNPTGATVWLDNTNTGEATDCLLDSIAPGDHPVRLTLGGYADWLQGVAVSANQVTTVNAVLVSFSDSEKVYLGTNAQGCEEYLWLKDSAVVVRIRAGAFSMGSDSGEMNERPVHTVYLDEYCIDKYEVTNRQYKRFCDATSRAYPLDPGFSSMPQYFTGYPDYPVVNVTWDDALAYANWTGRSLPSEAEWEKAARGPDAREFPWGSAEPDSTRCNISSNNDGYDNTAPVGTYPAGASPYGCMDMAGNVWEWCNDWFFAGYYAVSPDSNPQGFLVGSDRVFRGGCWLNSSWCVRCAYRAYYEPPFYYYHLGIRCSARL
jgi:formylglycine-generating enzyme required for sulfatase activity